VNYWLKSKLIILSKLLRYIKYRKGHQSGFCSVCGKQSFFLLDCDNKKESLRCIRCNAWMRLRYLSEQILKEYSTDGSKSLRELVNEKHFNSLNIYEAQAEGSLNTILKNCPNYVCSEYFEDVQPGESYKDKRCEDLQHLSFPDGAIDLIIHTSVMEHVRKPLLAFKEQYRVLKPSGILLFEIPMTDLNKKDLREKSRMRLDTSTGEDKFVLEPVYHGDPLRKKGALVYTDWGLDIVGILEKIGFNVSLESHPIKSSSSMSHIVIIKCVK